jgi:hypothetical protein
MITKNALKLGSIALAFSLFLMACGDTPGNGPQQPAVHENKDSAEDARIKELQKIFFSIPSPVEMSSLIKEKGYKFDASKLNVPENVDKYTGESRQAINLGIYGADLSYAAMFDEKQQTITYFAAAQKLARHMGVDGALTNDLVERLGKNQENRDSLLNIVSEAYNDLNGYLKENERIEISALVVAGGWLEALYLSTIYAQMDNNPDMRQRIAEQKFALKNLVDYYAKFGDRPNLKEMGDDLKALQEIFNQTASSPGKTTTSKDASGTVVIGTSSSVSISDETLKAIATKALEVRSKYTSF